jgi:FAD/FMN-containing dehydrogenase/Fe-S oxidoreductase
MPIAAEPPSRRLVSPPPRTVPTLTDLDTSALATELRRVVRGEVRFDAGTRGLYATDSSNYRQPPLGVVIPRDSEDVERAMAVCHQLGAPVFGRGCGTSLAGQCCNTAVAFDFSKYMNRVLEIDERRRLARVEPGTILDDLRKRTRPKGLTFGPDPATHSHCTLGGMVGNDSCGIHSVMAQFAGLGARTADNIESLEILTYDGVRMRVGATTDQAFAAIVSAGGRRAEIYTALKALVTRYERQIREGFPHLPRRVSGYNLTALLPEHGFNIARALVGTESTCVTVLEIVTHLIAHPRATSLLVLGYPDVYEAGDHVPQILEYRPIGLEGIDELLVQDMTKVGIRQNLKLLPEGKGWLIVEFGGDSKEEADEQAHRLMRDLAARPGAPTMKVYDDKKEEEEVWKVRESGLGATAHVSSTRPTWPGWEDSAVPPEKVGAYLRAFRDNLNRHNLHGALYGHLGQGCIHIRIDFDLESEAGIRQYRSFVEDAADLVVSMGGSISGEHGDGQARGELLTRMYGPELMDAFRQFKAIWDPDWRMNPGKVVEPYRLDENLRLGAGYNPPKLSTMFRYPRDRGSFATATLRCVGVGNCRRLEHGTMCPSFMVTREEKHSTRGRARLLFEVLQGDPVSGGWQDEHVKEALDLCLACKGCKGDCPVSVDMATYKAEFLSHYYAHHARPLSAYAFGLIAWWARLASLAPGLVNTFTQTPGLRHLMKAIVDMPQARQIPKFAPQTFRQWFAEHRAVPVAGRPRVILWPDTFNNHFHPETAIAAVRVLESAGFEVDLPRRPLCCGRPLYDYGLLTRAKRWLLDITRALESDITAGTPIVGLEPSCVSVFRDELTEMLPDRDLARRLSQQTFLLSDFLQEHAKDYRFPRMHRRAVLHGHCHHKAVLKFGAERQTLEAVGLDVQELDSGCCGMAGGFGFEQRHYDVSIKCGERVLLPAVREAAADALIVADGFSCREQIRQTTGRRALHLAEVLLMAARTGPAGPTGTRPEDWMMRLA